LFKEREKGIEKLKPRPFSLKILLFFFHSGINVKGVVKFTSGIDFIATISMFEKLFEHGILEFRKDKFMIKSIASNKSFASIYEIDSAMLDEYEVDEEFIIAVNLEDLKDLLKRHEKKEVGIKLEVDGYKLRCFITKKVGGRKKQVYSKLITELPFQDVKTVIPDLDIVSAFEKLKQLEETLSASVKIFSMLYSDVFTHDFKKLVDSYVFKGVKDENMVIVQGVGSDKDIEYVNEFRIGDEAVVEVDVKEDCESSYSSDNLTELASKIKKLSDIVEIKFGTYKPLVLKVNTIGNAVITYYQAPRKE